jgi:hypothetical protein
MNDVIKARLNDGPAASKETNGYAAWLKAKVQRSIASVEAGESRLYSLDEARARVEDILSRVKRGS